ncbi:MAG: sigma-54 dependent transcriptional regulator [Bacteroidota bacterium]
MTIQQIKQRYGIIGNCREINTAVEIAMQVAPTEVTVLVYGENGTGKDVFSRIIHDNSRRKHKSLIAINTGAIPEGTLDSELFGHEKGSFTSAYDSRKGYFEEVDGGSIFLDEIGEMPMATQARLLRLLETGDYFRVGSSKPQKADVRVVAATNRNLVDMIRNGRFREDLYFRLNTVTIQVPPLRERGDDIELLFNYFALEFGEKYKRDPIMLEDQAIDLLYQYRWPGNVRELRNLVEKLTVLVKGEWVSATVLQKNLLIQESYLPSIIPRSQSQTFDEGTGQLDGKDHEVLLKLIEEVSELKRMVAYLGLKDQQRQGSPVYQDSEPEYHNPTFEPDYHEPEILPMGQPIRRPSPPLLEESLNLEKKERELIVKALTKHNNNRKKAASELGISERTLYRKINNYDIEL